MNVLVLNCGSSSIKFQVIATDLAAIEQNADQRLARGVIERIGGEAVITLTNANHEKHRTTAQIRDIRGAVDYILRWLCATTGPFVAAIPSIQTIADLHAVGHRVVHGGEQFKQSVVIDAAVWHGIEECIDLAPLHNPANLKGMQAARDLLGGLPQVAVFDTAFHQTMPEHAYLYALPYQLYRRHRIRRYGFHGTSHRYVAHRYRQLTGRTREQTNIITLHLGNGCSATAIKAGDSLDTSMGMTPLEGLVMGTRSGDLDPSIIDLLVGKEGLSTHEIENLLNKQSGLLGVSGLTNDVRELLAEVAENRDRRAQLALTLFAYRAKKYIGAYLAALGGADALVFTGGIGENAAAVRTEICAGFAWCGLHLDEAKNAQTTAGHEGLISQPTATLAAYVIPTDEELLIARDTVRCVMGISPRQ